MMMTNNTAVTIQAVYANRFESPHNKTNNAVVRPAKTQISLGNCPVWSEFDVRLMGR